MTGLEIAGTLTGGWGTFQELRQAARALKGTPAQTLGAIIVLAMGLGATTAIYTLIDRSLLRPVDIQDPDRVVRFFDRRSWGPPIEGFVYSEWLEGRLDVESFEGVAAYAQPEGPIVLDRGGRPIAISAAAVSSNYFAVIAVTMVRGTGLRAEHDRPGAPPVAVLSDRAWRTLFDSAPDVVGKTIQVNEAFLTIVGVAPPGQHWPRIGRGPDIYVSLGSVPLLSGSFFNFFDIEPVNSESPTASLSLLGRLRPGVSLEQAEARANFLSRDRLVSSGIPDHAIRTAFLLPLNQAALPLQSRDETVAFLWLLACSIGLLLVLTCASVACLLLARIEARRHDLATRRALGAQPWLLGRLALTESLILSFCGGVLGLLVSVAFLRTVSAFSLPDLATMGSLGFQLDYRVALFSLLTAQATALACGLAPAWQAARTDIVTHLVSRPGSTGRARFTLQAPLVAVQVAVALTLLVGAALFERSLQSVLGRDLVFASQRLLIITPTTAGRGGSAGVVEARLPDTIARLRAVPGVESVALGPSPFGLGWGLHSILLNGQNVRLPEGQRFLMDGVGARYLTTIGVPILAGREILETDETGQSLVAVVNQSFAQRFWPGDAALGKRFRFLPFTRDFEIVGIVKDARFRDLDSGLTPCVYLPRVLLPPESRRIEIVIRSAADIRQVSGSVHSALAEVWPRELAPQVSTLKDLVAEHLQPQHQALAILGWLGSLAALVAIVGVSALVASGVAQRTHEIGVRLALGATRVGILALVSRQGMIPLAAGCVCGLLASVLLGNLIRPFLRDIGPFDPASFGAAVVLLLGAAALGIGVAAWRALRLDLVAALRAE